MDTAQERLCCPCGRGGRGGSGGGKQRWEGFADAYGGRWEGGVGLGVGGGESARRAHVVFGIQSS